MDDAALTSNVLRRFFFDLGESGEYGESSADRDASDISERLSIEFLLNRDDLPSRGEGFAPSSESLSSADAQDG